MTDAPNTKMRVQSTETAHGKCDKTMPLSCHLDPLAAGAHATVTVVAVPLGAGAVVNLAHVTIQNANTAPPHSVFSTARTEVLVPLRLTKTASAHTALAGTSLSYKILVTNRNNVTARQVRVCDRLPGGLVFESASVKTRLRSGSLCWTVTSIGAHSHRAFTMSVRALSGISGNRVNNVTITGPAIAARHAHASVRILPAPSPPTPVTG